MELDKNKIKVEMTVSEYEQMVQRMNALEHMIDRSEEQIRKDVIKDIQLELNWKAQIGAIVVSIIMTLIINDILS